MALEVGQSFMSKPKIRVHEVNPRKGFGNALKLKCDTQVKCAAPFSFRETEGNCCL